MMRPSLRFWGAAAGGPGGVGAGADAAGAGAGAGGGGAVAVAVGAGAGAACGAYTQRFKTSTFKIEGNRDVVPSEPEKLTDTEATAQPNNLLLHCNIHT